MSSRPSNAGRGKDGTSQGKRVPEVLPAGSLPDILPAAVPRRTAIPPGRTRMTTAMKMSMRMTITIGTDTGGTAAMPREWTMPWKTSGKPADWLVVQKDKPDDVYIIAENIFGKTYISE